MAVASEKARPRIMLVWMVGVASGLRPMASTAPPATMPMPMPPPSTPMAARPAPIYFRPMMKIVAASASIVSDLLLMSAMRSGGQPSARTKSVRGGCFRVTGVVLRLVVVAVMADDSLAHEGERQHREHVGLNDAHEDFQPVEHAGHDHGGQRAQDGEQQRAGEDVAEQPEAKREDLGELRHQLQQAHQEVDEAEDRLADHGANVDEFLEVA